MASVINEIESLAEFIEPLFAGASVHYQQIPVEPKVNSLILRYLSSNNATETNYHYRIDREYQIVYFAQNEFACLQKFEQLERKLNDVLVIPLKNSDRYLRLEFFSFSQPFKTESGTVTAILGILRVSLREPRTQNPYNKIGQVHAEIRSEIGVTVTKTNC
ncbi:hypothetical protein [Cytobacillus massiliigabonensis]|uniref:hypothetical protein n=1 Tax=Cytobacillus massiliigabonensis TaxID=1871011 RepID=UPI000C85B24A|nr:hypothetical protein [Cytobacillus massiliigabonensis]